MSVPPTIPTSFVPKQPLDPARRPQRGGTNIFFIIATILLGVSLAAAGGVFGYQKYLENVKLEKQAELKQAEQSINRDTVEEYIRLKERFVSGRQLLDQHVATSQFFVELERATLQNVRFDDLTLTVADDRSAEVTLTGTARNFNTLAAQSNAIAANSAFRRSIFSDIAVAEGGAVSFTLTADIEPRTLIRRDPSLAPATTTAPAAPAAPVSTSTPGTTTPTI